MSDIVSELPINEKIPTRYRLSYRMIKCPDFRCTPDIRYVASKNARVGSHIRRGGENGEAVGVVAVFCCVFPLYVPGTSKYILVSSAVGKTIRIFVL